MCWPRCFPGLGGAVIGGSFAGGNRALSWMPQSSKRPNFIVPRSRLARRIHRFSATVLSAPAGARDSSGRRTHGLAACTCSNGILASTSPPAREPKPPSAMSERVSSYAV